MKPTTLILRTAGTNCDGETAHAFELAGARTQKVHINELVRRPQILREYQIVAFPGGFSYGDDIAAGRILANQIARHLHEELRAFIDAGKPVIGICNGFQVLVKTDLLPGPLGGRTGQTATLVHNDCGRFVDRWVHVSARSQKCIWTAGLDQLDLPIAHGEGRFIPGSDGVRQALWEGDQVALVYVRPDGSPAAGELHHNPNGSVDDIAGICDASGLVLGLMPHPERFVDGTQHPSWTRMPWAKEGAGLRVFQNAVERAAYSVGGGV